MRGNRLRLDRYDTQIGSIPAYAGEPTPSQQPLRRARVYPRVCGGTKAADSPARRDGGLSPRMRGNQHRIRRFDGNDGSIPAYAGEPRGQSPGRRRGTVYPRVCGGTL